MGGPWTDRGFRAPGEGTELNADGSKFDVPAWRTSLLAAQGGSSSSATLSQVTINSSTSVIVKAASTDFIYFAASNDNNDIVWLKFQSAATDNDKKGIMLEKGDFYEMTSDKYTGEISAISATTGTTLNVTTY